MTSFTQRGRRFIYYVVAEKWGPIVSSDFAVPGVNRVSPQHTRSGDYDTVQDSAISLSVKSVIGLHNMMAVKHGYRLPTFTHRLSYLWRDTPNQESTL